ncbi:VCBS repeat-containing protein [bacterium]|nr:VCBS repeat-containing protein [bacterium]
MLSNRIVLKSLALASALTVAGWAAPESAVEFHLDGPHIYDAYRRSLGLTVADLNGDGHMDIASVSNDAGLLEILYQSEDNEAAPFTKEEITLDGLVQSMIAADVNGDGRTDLLMAEAPASLVVMYQTDEGRLQRGEMTDLKADHLTLGELNGDGREDVLLVVGKKMQILQAGTRGISLEPVETFYTTGQVSDPPMIADIDGDGKNDIIFQPGDSYNHLMVRLQSATGDFPAEFSLETSLLRSVDMVPMPRERAKIAAIHNKTRHLVIMQMAEPMEDHVDGESTLSISDPRFVGFDPSTWDQDTFSAVADVDGDGREDLVAAMPNSASLRLLSQTRTGALVPETVPSLEGMDQILPWPVERGTAAPLVVLSEDENALGVAMVDKDKDNRLGFPRPLALDAQPLAAGILHSEKNSTPDLLVVQEDAEEKKSIVVYKDFDPTADSVPAAEEVYVLEDDAEAPEGMTIADLDRDGREDIILHFEYESPLLLMQTKDGHFTKREVRGILSGLLADTNPSQLFAAQLKGEDRPLVMCVKDDYVRAFYLEEDGSVHIAQQFNGRNNRTRLRAAAVADLRGDGSREVAMLDVGNGILSIHGVKKGKKSYELLREIELGDVNYRRMEAFDLDGDKRDDLVLVALDRIAVLYSRVMNGDLETIDSYETEIEDGGYGLVRAIPLLGNPNHPQIVCVEMREKRLEFFNLERAGRGSDLTLTSLYEFRVFESESTIARRVNMDASPEPRQFAADDLNGDGNPDLAILVIDKLIVYYQQ